MRYVNYRDRKAVACDLRPAYTAPNAKAAEHELERFDEKWGGQYPMSAASWREHWETHQTVPAAARGPGPDGLHHQHHRGDQLPSD